MQTFPVASLLLAAAIVMEPMFFGSAAAFLQNHVDIVGSTRRSNSNFLIEGVGLESESTSVKKKKKKQSTGSTKNGFGGGKPSSSSSSSTQIKKTPFDASSALIRSAKLYEELSLKASKVMAAAVENDEENYEGEDDKDEEVYSEFLIAAKYVSPTQEDGCSYPPGSAGLSDWVPVAQLCLIRNRSTLSSTNTQLHSAVSTHCREIYHAAQTVAPIFNNIPRSHIRYSAEPLDSFFKYVYDNVLADSSPQPQSDEVMTKAQARDILGIPLESTNDLSLIKQRYRTLSMQYHPDSAVTTAVTSTQVDDDDDDDIDISAKFRQVRLAYDTLCSGIRVTDATGTATGSFYETLGGKDRTDFLHIPTLISPDEARNNMSKTMQSAVIGLDSDTVMAFVTRNLAASVVGNTKNNMTERKI